MPIWYLRAAVSGVTAHYLSTLCQYMVEFICWYIYTVLNLQDICISLLFKTALWKILALLRPLYTSRPVEGVLFRCNAAIIHKFMKNYDWQLFGVDVQKLEVSEILWR